MNYGPKMVEHLARTPALSEILLAPGAPPLGRTEQGMVPLWDKPLAQDDIRDTLLTFRSLSGERAGTPGKEGSFSLGMPNVGRFRVSFLSQRGSYVVLLAMIPSEVPSLKELLEDPADAGPVVALLAKGRRGLLAVTGSSTVRSNALVYCLLKQVSEEQRRVIYVLERSLTYLLRHGQCVVLQGELGIDFDSVEDGLHMAQRIGPDVVYLRDAVTESQLLGLMKVAETGSFCVATLPTDDEARSIRGLDDLARRTYGDLPIVERYVLHTVLGPGGRLAVHLKGPPAAG